MAVPRVSIVLCTYNRASQLAEAIKSVLDQDYRDFELIIVDDASNDGTEDVVRSFDDARIVFTKNESNKGAAASRNKGINMSQGELIAFQDSDDLWLEGKLSRQVKELSELPESYGACYSAFWRKDASGTHLLPGTRPEHEAQGLFQELLKANLVAMPTLLVRKSCLDQVGIFDESFRRLIDWDLALRIAHDFSMRFCDEPLLFTHHMASGISEDVDAYLEAIDLLVSKHAADYRRRWWLVANHYLFNAKYLARHRRFREAFKQGVRALKVLFDRIACRDIRINPTGKTT